MLPWRHYHRRGRCAWRCWTNVAHIYFPGWWWGLGLEEQSNPFFNVKTPFLTSLFEGKSLTREASGKDYAGATLLALDAVLGVKGRPQSATGQTSLFTGVNAAAVLGRHLRGFPNRL